MGYLINKRGEGYVDVVVLVLALMLCLALVVKVLPVFIVKYQLDTFATELKREAEIAGRIGPETSERINKWQAQTGLSPTIAWSKTGEIHINEKFSVTLQTSVNIGLFGNFASFPIELTAKANGKSEVYWK